MTSSDRVGRTTSTCGRRAADDQQRRPTPPGGGQAAGEGEREQLEPVRVAARAPRPGARRRAAPASTRPAGEPLDPVHHEDHHGRNASASQYRLTVLATPTSAAGSPGASSGRPSSPPVSPPGSRATRIAPDLGEGQRHHGERDARRSAARPRRAARQQRSSRRRPPAAPPCHSGQPGPGDQDVGAVDAGGEVQRVPEGEQPGPAEQQVVAERQAAEDQAEWRAAAGCPGEFSGPSNTPGRCTVEYGRIASTTRRPAAGRSPAPPPPSGPSRARRAVDPSCRCHLSGDALRADQQHHGEQRDHADVARARACRSS